MSFTEKIERMRNGEKIKCPKCEDGYVAAVGKPKDAYYFSCTCGFRITLTKKLELDI